MARRELRVDLVRFNSSPLTNSPFKDVTNTQNLQLTRKCSPPKPRSTINNSSDEDLFETIFHLKPLKTYRPSLQNQLPMKNASSTDKRIEDWIKEQAVHAVARLEDTENSNVENDGTKDLKRTENINGTKRKLKVKMLSSKNKAGNFPTKSGTQSRKNKCLDNQRGAKSTRARTK